MLGIEVNGYMLTGLSTTAEGRRLAELEVRGITRKFLSDKTP